MVVKSATKKYLRDLGLPESVAHQLADDTGLKEIHQISAKRFYEVLVVYHTNNTTLGNLWENMALWYGLIVHYPISGRKLRHRPSFIHEGNPWSWGKVTGGTLPISQKKHMVELMEKYMGHIDNAKRFGVRGLDTPPYKQIAINWTRYLNKIKCGGCQKLWKPDKMDIYGETCPVCQDAYSGNMDSIPSFDELAK